MGKDLVAAEPGQYIFPEIQFDCEMYITKWIYNGEPSASSGNQSYPELQIWNALDDDYVLIQTQTHYTVSIELTDLAEICITPETPIPVQVGSVLGIFISQNSAPLYFDEDNRNGRESLYINTANPLDLVTTLSSTEESRFIPEVTVELSKLSIEHNLLTVNITLFLCSCRPTLNHGYHYRRTCS